MLSVRSLKSYKTVLNAKRLEVHPQLLKWQFFLQKGLMKQPYSLIVGLTVSVHLQLRMTE